MIMFVCHLTLYNPVVLIRILTICHFLQAKNIMCHLVKCTNIGTFLQLHVK